MKKVFTKNMKKSWIVTGLSLVIAMIGIFIMPDIIPTHFGPEGTPDDWGSKYFIFLYPGVLVLVMLLAEPFKGIDPKLQNYARFDKYYYNFFLGFALFFLGVEIANVAIAMGIDINVGSVTCFLVGVLMFFLGNMMPKIKQNYFFGIKTPWALADEENWYKTHRLGGKIFAVCGIIIILGAFLPGDLKVWSIVITLIPMVLIPYVYSALLHKRKQDIES